MSPIAVVIPTYNHAHFLGDAIRSVVAQTVPAYEIIVVDDGSQDDPAAVVAETPQVKLVRQTNQGLSAARNTGLSHCVSPYVLFLDADDILHPDAVKHSLACFEAHPEAGFVYGGHRRVNEHLQPTEPPKFSPCNPQRAFNDFLKGNLVGMHATVVYDRLKLVECGGFDTKLKRCEDYDVYLRLSQRHSVIGHPHIIADYRWHSSNMSDNHAEMLTWVLRVHARYKPKSGGDSLQAWQQGRSIWRNYYADQGWKDFDRVSGRLLRAKGKWNALRMSPAFISKRIVKNQAYRVARLIPSAMADWLKRWFAPHTPPRVGQVRLGDFQRTSPVSRDFGFDRGTPIDRFYIESFLAAYADDIKGRALEIGDAAYCKRFGANVSKQEVMHVSADAPEATIVGDLSQAGCLPANTFDSMVLTQTLHLIYDMRAAVQEIYQALRPGGVLLLTVPGITSIDRGTWRDTWYWSLTSQSAQRLFGDVFGEANVRIGVHGNVYAATCFLMGLSLEEVEKKKLEVFDASYPVIITVRAQKS